MKNLVWIVVIFAILGGGYLLMQKKAATTAPADTTGASEAANVEQATSTNPAADSNSGASVVVTYSATGFSPAEVTIKKGATVTWKNESGGEMWVATGPHPAHTGYSDTNLAAHCPDTSAVAFDQCASGATYSFKFDKVGTWPYHNHKAASKYGKVIVTE